MQTSIDSRHALRSAGSYPQAAGGIPGPETHRTADPRAVVGDDRGGDGRAPPGRIARSSLPGTAARRRDGARPLVLNTCCSPEAWRHDGTLLTKARQCSSSPARDCAPALRPRTEANQGLVQVGSSGRVRVCCG